MWSSNKSEESKNLKEEKLNSLLDSTCEFYSSELQKVDGIFSLKKKELTTSRVEVEKRHILIEELRNEIKFKKEGSVELERLLDLEETHKKDVEAQKIETLSKFEESKLMFDSLNDELEKYKNEISEATEELSEKREQVRLNEEGIARLSEQSNLFELKASASKLIKKQVEQDLEQVTELIKVKKELSQKMNEEVSQLEKELPKLTFSLDEGQTKLSEIEKDLSAKSEKLTQLTDRQKVCHSSIKEINENIHLKNEELSCLGDNLKLEQENIEILNNEISVKSETLKNLRVEQGQLELRLLDTKEGLDTQNEKKLELEKSLAFTSNSVESSKETLSVFEQSISDVSLEIDGLEKRLETKKNIAEKAKSDIESKQLLIKKYLLKVSELNETLNTNLFNMKDMVSHDPKLNEKVMGLFAQMSSLEGSVQLSTEVAQGFLDKVELAHEEQGEIFETKSQNLEDGLINLASIQEKVSKLKEDHLKKEELLGSIDRRIDKRFKLVNELEEKLIQLEVSYTSIDHDVDKKSDVLDTLDQKIVSLKERESSLLKELNIQSEIFEMDQKQKMFKRSSLEKKQKDVENLEGELKEIQNKLSNRTANMDFINIQINETDKNIAKLEKAKLLMQSDLDEILSKEEEQKVALASKANVLDQTKASVSLIKEVIEDKKENSSLLELSDLDELKTRFEKKFFNIDLNIKRTNKFVLDENSMSKINIIEKTIEHFLSNVESEFGYDIEAESIIELKSRAGNATVNFSGFKKLSSIMAKDFFSSLAKEIMKTHKKDGLSLKFKTKTTLLKDLSSLEVIASIDWNVKRLAPVLR